MNDLKYALRALAKSPVFSIIAVATLALGIGLNTAMFSLMNAIYLRPLPFPNSASLVRVYRATPETREGDVSAGDFADLKGAAPGFGEFAGSAEETVSLAEPGRPAVTASALRVSSNYLSVLGVHPEVGRTFRAEEELAGNHRVVVISHALWQERYGGNPEVLGTSIRVGGETHEIIGVLPEGANDGRVLRQIDILRPFGFSGAERASRLEPYVRVIGRRLATVSERQGSAIVAAVGARLAQEHPKEDGSASLRSVALLGATGNQGGRIVAYMLLGLSGFVLLIACSNLANFVIARTIERSQELSVRSALGASLFHLIRPLAIESLTIAAAGGAAALLVALWSADWLSAQSVASGGSPMAFPLDWRVLAFAVFSSLATALVFGTAPGLLITRLNVNETLKVGMRHATTGTRQRKLRSLLVIGQFAMAMTLLAGAAFLVRGTNLLIRQQYGWNSDSVIVGAFDLPKAKYGTAEAILAFQRRLLTELRAIPGVGSAALSFGLPYSGALGPRQYLVEGRARPAKGQEPAASFDGISPDYFRVTGSRLVSGRPFDDTDTAKSTHVAIINESMARSLFPDENPIGHRLARTDTETLEWAEIVGIAADVRPTGLYQQPPAFQVYHPLTQEPWQYSRFAVRAQPGAMKAVLGSVGKALAAVDPDLPVRDLMSADALVERSSFDLAMLKKMLGLFAVLGLGLAALGIYGVIARTVVQRTPEIGIRMALGATTGNVRALVLRAGLRLALAGVGLGLAGAYGITRFLTSMMPAIGGAAAAVVAETVAALGFVALLACYLPARAASRVDPVTAIRAE